MGAQAKVRLMLEVDLPDNWGNECLLGQVFRQSSDQALQKIRNSLPPDVRIIGTPEVTAILLPERKD